jgi:hypothetical protein
MPQRAGNMLYVPIGGVRVGFPEEMTIPPGPRDAVGLAR